MSDLAFLRERIESYADYTDDAARRLSDEQIRAYAGEALARLRERLAPGGAEGQALEALLLRCQFVEQTKARVFDATAVDAAQIAATAAADRDVVNIADCADTVAAADLGVLLVQLAAAFERRWPAAGGTLDVPGR